MIKRYIAILFVVGSFIFTATCDTTSGNLTRNALVVGDAHQNPTDRKDLEADYDNIRDDANVNSTVAAAANVQPQLARVNQAAEEGVARAGAQSSGSPTGQSLLRARRAPVKGRKILLAKAPKPTTTTTTTTSAPASASAEDEPEEDEEDSGEGEGEGEPETQQESGAEQVSASTGKATKEQATPGKLSGLGKQQQQQQQRQVEGGRKGSRGGGGGGKIAATSKGSRANASESETVAKKKKPVLSLPFIRPKNESMCTPEAYLEFPHDLIGNKWRARGLVLIHVAVVCYMFYSLALVCERYFMPSLEEFSQRLQLSEDVAGATLMSAGSSAPELFTAILGVFIAKGDVGTGAIVGSAVFNILFVIGICAFVSTTTAQLNWWPVLRDSVFYTFTVLVLIVFIYDERVTALESFAMIALYGVYILIMVHNDTVKGHVTRTLLSHPLTSKLISSAVSVDGPDDVFGSSSSSSHPISGAGGRGGSGKQHRDYQTTATATTNLSRSGVEEDSMFLAAMLVIVQHKRLFRGHLRFQSAARYVIVKRQHRLQQQQPQQKPQCFDEVNYFGPESEEEAAKGLVKGGGAGSQKQRMQDYASNAALSKNKFSIVSKDDYEFWNRPPEEGENYYIWLAKIPVNYVLHYTIPDCTLNPDKYLFTFLISITWTAIFSYIMVWMVTLIGYTFGIPDSVMGVTFLAAGTSIPDCYSSVHAARNGMADMAVSNSIGSNVFDILIGLSLPWFIQTAIYPGVVATINSRGVIYSVILLFLSLVVTIYLMNKYEWTLKPRLGLALLIAYGLFIVLTCMLEFNLFGNVNPPPCPVAN